MESSVDKDSSALMESSVDKYELVPAYLKGRGLAKLHINSFNTFINEDIERIIRANRVIKSKNDPDILLRFDNVRIGRPYDGMTFKGGTKDLSPLECRSNDSTYKARILVDIQYVKGNCSTKQLLTKKEVVIGEIPIMLKSCRCVLHGKSDAEIAAVGECPLDPGGYFIVNGIEKVVLIQEDLSKNRIIIDKDSQENIRASVISSTKTKENKTVVIMLKDQLYLLHDEFTEKIPLMVVMLAMGMVDLNVMCQWIGDEGGSYVDLFTSIVDIVETETDVCEMNKDPYIDLLLQSIEVLEYLEIRTEQEALKYLGSKVKHYKDTAQQKESKALRVLREILLANVPIHSNNLRPKALFLALMARRVMETILKKDVEDDQESMGNKQLVMSGQMFSLLFEDLFNSMVDRVKQKLDKDTQSRSGEYDLLKILFLERNIITHGFARALLTGNWDVKRIGMHKKGVSQVLSRMSFIGTLSFMTKIASQSKKFGKVDGDRSLHPTQIGMLCPCDTPVGECCGLVKHLGLMAHVTAINKKADDDALTHVCKASAMQSTEVNFQGFHRPPSFLVICNGLILGTHDDSQDFADSLRKSRRMARISPFVSVFVNEKQHRIYIASDGGRVCRPLVIADKGKSRIKQHHMDKFKAGGYTFDDFVHDGLIEYLDVNEECNSLISLDEANATTETTHIEIAPFAMLGVSAGLIPYPHHNESTRNSYQCAIGKQAVGSIAHNQLRRTDTLLNLLVYPQRPLSTTRTIELVGVDKLGAGQNAIVAVMSFSGYDMGNAITMNKSSLDRGFGRSIVMKKYAVESDDKIARPDKDNVEMRVLDVHGVAAPGEIIKMNDIYINSYTPNPKRYISNMSGREEPHVVDRVAIFSDRNNNSLCYKFMIREVRRPEVGDRFSSRHGQKSVCGLIVQQEDYPFSEGGICPDLTINPHDIASLPVVGQLIEVLGGKAAALRGSLNYGTAFGESSDDAETVEAISGSLLKHGFSYQGKDFLYSGITGSPLNAYIFMGPIYYQRLKHMVVDKIHARGHGVRDMLTRQPVRERAKNGALRVGEMERDCLIAHGASMLIYERLMISGDSFEVQVCRVCGLLGYYNHKLKTGICSTCKNGDNISTMKLPYACKLLIQELQSMNIVPRLKLAEP